MINVTFLTLLWVSCLIVAVLSFLNGIDRAKVEKEEEFHSFSLRTGRERS